jgi:hypothetical protein
MTAVGSRDTRELHSWAGRCSEEEPVSSLLGIWQGMLACPGRSTLPVPSGVPPSHNALCVHSMRRVPSGTQTAVRMSV